MRGLAVVALAGCLSQPPRPTFDDAAIAAACTALSQAECDLRDACSYMDYSARRVYGDDATCVTRGALVCIADLHVKDTSGNTAHLEACATSMTSESCTDYFDGNPSSRCAIAPGPGAIGSSCAANAQCKSTFCLLHQYATCGTCQPIAEPGTPCTINTECGRGLACEVAGGATSGTCAPYAPVGMPCLTGSMPCAAGNSCVGDSPASNTMGTCQTAARDVGAACDSSRQTMATCDPTYGLACIAATGTIGTCQPIQLVGAGETCGTVGTGASKTSVQCLAGGVCVKPVGMAMGTCVGATGDGAACAIDPTVGPPCADPAVCAVGADGMTGTCEIPDPTACF